MKRAEVEPRSFGLVCAAASISDGALLGEVAAGAGRERLEGLAAMLPELFGTLDATSLDRISERLGVEVAGELFGEILLFSEQYLHLIQPLRGRPGVALLAVTSAEQSMGLLLSAVRNHALELEAK